MEQTTIVSKEDCLKILKKYSRGTSGFDLVNYRVFSLDEEPLGYLAEHYQLQIVVNTPKKLNITLNFFMKTIPNDTDAHREYVANIGVFEKEAKLYKGLLSKLQDCSSLPFAPLCFAANSKSFIVLEDLSLKGFTVIKNKSTTLDLSHCACVIETLARFHAASIILEEINSTETDKYRLIDHYNDAMAETTFSFIEGHPRNNWINTTTDTLIKICKEISGYEDRNCEVKLVQLVKKMKEYIGPSKDFRNVVNHGDLWANNIMFNYSEEMVPKQCVLVDFQMIRYVPPAFDFLTFLYLTTSKQFYLQNFSYFVDLYYDTFAFELERNNLNPANILSKQRFLDCCKYYKPAALLEAAMFGTIVYLSDSYSKDLLSDSDKFQEFMCKDRSKVVCDAFKKDKVYCERLSSVVTQLLDLIL